MARRTIDPDGKKKEFKTISISGTPEEIEKIKMLAEEKKVSVSRMILDDFLEDTLEEDLQAEMDKIVNKIISFCDNGKWEVNFELLKNASNTEQATKDRIKAVTALILDFELESKCDYFFSLADEYNATR